jgi:hypothetical protein
MGLIERSARVIASVGVIAFAMLAPVARAGVDLPLASDAFLPLGPPALAGDDLFWVQRHGRGFDLVQRSSSGAVSSILSRQGIGNRTATARLEASATNVVLETSQNYPVTCVKCDPPLPLLTVEAGAVGSQLEQVGSTCEYDPTLFMRSIDVDRASFVSHGPECRHWTTGLIRGDGNTELAPLPDGITLPRIAGRYVAWLELTPHAASGNVGDVVVRDRDLNTEVYRLPRASVGFVSSLSLRDDGTVALSSLSTPGRGRVEWASPAEPFLHPVGPPADGYEVRIAGDLIGYHRTRFDPSSGTVPDPDSYRSEVGTLTLDGMDRIAGTGVASAFDFDGTRLAWATAGCTHATLRVRTVGEPLVPSARADCALRLAEAPRLRPGGVRFRLSCTGFGRGCRAGFIEVTTPAPGGRPVLVALLRHTSAGSAITVPLTHAGIRVVRRRPNRLITISAGVQGPSGRFEQRSARFRMRP